MKLKLGRGAGGARNAASFSTLLGKRKENKGQEGEVLGVNDTMYLCHGVFTDHISILSTSGQKHRSTEEKYNYVNT